MVIVINRGSTLGYSPKIQSLLVEVYKGVFVGPRRSLDEIQKHLGQQIDFTGTLLWSDKLTTPGFRVVEYGETQFLITCGIPLKKS